jgi:hypothetical protein
LAIGPLPFTYGIFDHTASPSTSDAEPAWATRSSGIFAQAQSGRIFPVRSSSRRESSERTIRKLEATIPLASPECTPSVRTSTLSVPAIMPRSDVVLQSRS